jgi:hypothetical protein
MPLTPFDSVSQSKLWFEHFEANRLAPDALPWDHPYRLSQQEVRAIQKSIQQFQLGESAEGRRLLKRGDKFARTAGDPYFVDTLGLFIKEEQRHSRQLLRFMQQQAIPALEGHWVDGVFRRLRVLAGLELELRVLVTAEIIAVPYYRALGRATGSQLLRAICDRILVDEAAHLQFQSSMLARIEANRSRLLRRCVWRAHRLFLLGTCSLVWLTHASVFAAARYSFGQLVREACAEFSNLQSMTSRISLGVGVGLNVAPCFSTASCLFAKNRAKPHAATPKPEGSQLVER